MYVYVFFWDKTVICWLGLAPVLTFTSLNTGLLWPFLFWSLLVWARALWDNCFKLSSNNWHPQGRNSPLTLSVLPATGPFNPTGFNATLENWHNWNIVKLITFYFVNFITIKAVKITKIRFYPDFKLKSYWQFVVKHQYMYIYINKREMKVQNLIHIFICFICIITS